MKMRMIPIFLTTGSAALIASPSQDLVDSREMLKKIGAKIEYHTSAEATAKSAWTSFAVTYAPKTRDDDCPPLVSVIFWRPGSDRDFGNLLHRFDYPLERDGKCRAKFTLAHVGLDAIELRFRMGWNTEYVARLSDVVNDFAESHSEVGKATPTDAGRAAPAADRKSNEKSKPKKDAKPRPR